MSWQNIVDVEALEEALQVKRGDLFPQVLQRREEEQDVAYVVCYANQEQYNGTDLFWKGLTASVPQFGKLDESCLIRSLRAAIYAAVTYPTADDAHQRAKVMKAKRVSRWELSELD